MVLPPGICEAALSINGLQNAEISEERLHFVDFLLADSKSLVNFLMDAIQVFLD
jgi:hypothetical protein